MSLGSGLPYNLAAGTKPVADQVQGNDAFLFENLVGIKVFGKTGGAGTKRTTIGTSNDVVLSQTFSVAVPSVLKIDYSGIVHYGNQGDGQFVCQLGVLLDGVGTFGVSRFSENADDPSGPVPPSRIRDVTVAGTQLVSLTAGSHTVALQWTTQIIADGGITMSAEGVQGTTAYWSGLVVPVP